MKKGCANLEKIKKVINVFVSVFLVSWIGSYTYEAFRLHDRTENLLLFIKEIPTILSEYMFIYAIDSQLNIFVMLIPALFVLYSVCMSIPLLIKKIKKDGNFSLTMSKLRTISTIVLGSAYLFFILSVVDIKVSLISNIETNLEIVRPYINENDYFLMKSDYLQMTDKKSFNKIDKRIKEIAKLHDLQLK